jgi:peptide chain release factor 1
VRVPPTEKYNRVQTSFITVTIMNQEEKSEYKLDRNDLKWAYTRSHGNGGQNVNKVESCVQLTHIPTGIQIKVQDTRDQNKNKEIAYQRIYNKLKSIEDQKKYQETKDFRNDQIGEGGRGLKRRTYRLRDDIVIDHITGKTCRWRDILKGKIELLS